MKENENQQMLDPEESQKAHYEKPKDHPIDILELLGKAEASDVMCTPDEDYGGDRVALVTVQFGEGKMSVLHDYTFPFSNITELLYNIDAKAVLDALNVNSYRDALNAFRDRFYGINAYNQIEYFLKINKIGSEYTHDVINYDEEGNPLNE